MSRTLPLVVALLLAAPAPAQTLLYDDFTGGSLNSGNWNVANWTFNGNRTWFGHTPTVAGGVASLKLDTHNPDHAGYLKGTEIYSKQSFALGATGIDFEARVRTNMTTAGAVTSFFTYATTSPNNYAQEIDFEVLTKHIGSNRVIATTWKDWGAPGSNFNNGVNHRNNDPVGNAGQPAGVDLTQWTTLRIRWLPTRTEWYVNDSLFYTTTDAHPTTAMPIRMNFWAPDSTWGAAYDAGLQAVSSPGANTSFTYDVDYVKVMVVPVPEPAGLLLLAGAVGVAAGRRRR
jgi:hypothetical protein